MFGFAQLRYERTSLTIAIVQLVVKHSRDLQAPHPDPLG